MNDKEFFKIMKHECKEFYDVFYDSFPYWVMQIYFLDLSKDEIENAVDSLDHNDESIDGFFINHNTKEIIIIQCKTSDSEKQLRPCKKEWLSYLYDVPNKLLNHDYIDNHNNQKIKDIAAEYSIYKSKNYKTTFYFFHLGYMPNENNDIINSYNNDEYTFIYFSLKDIKIQYAEYKSKTELTEPTSFEIKLSYSKNVDSINERIGKHHTFISIITGEQIVKLREEHRYKLFDKNVRFNLGTNKINKEIIDSALQSSDEFYFYNNGITITCTSFKYRENNKTVRVDYPQIINGAQTVDSLYSAYNKRCNKLVRIIGDEEKAKMNVNDEFSKIKVLFRLIQSEKHDSKFAINVIKYNNSQNAIQIRDFFSNNPEQIELQKKFANYGYFYEIKRGERIHIKKEKHIHLNKRLFDFEYSNDKIDIEKLASLYRAFIGEPSAKEVGAKYILGDTEVYQYIFGSSITDIYDKKVREMILAYNIFNLIENEAKLYKKTLINLPKIDNSGNNFNELKKLIDNSSIFGNVFKSKFFDYEKYKEKKDTLNKKIREYYPFSQGKYHMQAIFKLILDECNYLNSLIESDLFKDKDFINDKIVKPWLTICLDKLLVPVYIKAYNEESVSVSAFYLRTKSFNNIKALFEQLDINEDKDLKEIFNLSLDSSN